MSATSVRGAQILDHTVQRVDLDVTTPGQAVVTKVVQGSGIILNASGADAGTGDVTISTVPTSFFDLVMSGPVNSSAVTGDDDDKVTVS